MFVTMTAGVRSSSGRVRHCYRSICNQWSWRRNSNIQIRSQEQYVDWKIIPCPAWYQWCLCLLSSDCHRWWVFIKSSIQISIPPGFYPFFPQHHLVLITVQQRPLLTTEAQPWFRSRTAPCSALASMLGRTGADVVKSNKIGGRWQKEQYTVTVSRNARLLIMVLGENHHDMMTIQLFSDVNE